MRTDANLLMAPSVISDLPALDAWNFDRFCRRWHRHSDAHLEFDWLVLVGHALVHHGTVLVPFDVCFETLQRMTPLNFAFFLRGHRPLREAVKARPEVLRLSCRYKVDECIPKRSLSIEVDWQIEKVVLAIETMQIDELE